MDDTQKWFLLKNDDGALFGPIAFEQLREWAMDAQISPLDKISHDERNWVKAPMIPELAMDFLVEVSPDQFYGPTTIGAVREFLALGEIHAETPITNCRDGSSVRVRDIPELQLADAQDDSRPVRTSIRVNLQQRIRDLEEALMEERRARRRWRRLNSRRKARGTSW